MIQYYTQYLFCFVRKSTYLNCKLEGIQMQNFFTLYPKNLLLLHCTALLDYQNALKFLKNKLLKVRQLSGTTIRQLRGTVVKNASLLL